MPRSFQLLAPHAFVDLKISGPAGVKPDIDSLNNFRPNDWMFQNFKRLGLPHHIDRLIFEDTTAQAGYRQAANFYSAPNFFVVDEEMLQFLLHATRQRLDYKAVDFRPASLEVRFYAVMPVEQI